MKEMKLKGYNIGGPQIHGTLETTSEGLRITAGGVDIWGVEDCFYYVAQKQQGDFDLIVCLEKMTNRRLYAKAGIMVRESLEENSKHQYFMVFPDNSSRNNNNGGFEFQYRMHTGEESHAVYPKDDTCEPPLYPCTFPETWMRLKRTGDDFYSYCRPYGEEWVLYCKFTMKFEQKEIFLGFAVCANNDEQEMELFARHLNLY